MNEKDIKLLEENGWTVECESPFEIRTKDGSFASGEAAWMVLHALEDEIPPPPTYYVLRRCNCVTADLKTGKIDTDIIGVTTDEDYAKERQTVFCGYEPVILLK